jgi:ketosteroid isomerase-like protein
MLAETLAKLRSCNIRAIKGGIIMKKATILLTVGLLVAGILILSACSTMGKSKMEADVAAIDKIWEGYTAGVNTGNANLWLSLWDENGIRLAPDAPAAHGKAQILPGIQKAFGAFNLKVDIKAEEIVILGDWAFSSGTFTRRMAPKAGGPEIFFDGKFLTLFKRQPDGSWKIFRDCFNSNVPPK